MISQAKSTSPTPILWLEASLLFVAGILLRLPFQSAILHEWDSVQFALALDHFDIRLHQPHPPGMFLFYIFLGRLLNLYFRDANTSLVWVSMLATGFGVATLYLITTNWFGRTTGWIIALVMLSSPLVWFQGEVALSYMLEFSWVLLIIWNCFNLRYGNKFAFFTATLLIGLSGGIRPNTLFFTFPLWFIAVFVGFRERKYHFKDLFLAVTIGSIAVASWWVPLILMSGGWDSYWQAMESWLNRHPQDGVGRGFYGTYLNLKMLGEALIYGLGFALIPSLWLGWKQGKQLLKKLSDWRGITLICWILPGFSYLTFVHMQRLGHSFTILPAFIILGGWATYKAGQILKPFKPNATLILATMVVLGNTLLFLFVPGRLDNVPTWKTIRDYDRYIHERVTLVRAEFAPTETIVVTRGRNARIREFYLSDYAGSSYIYEPGRIEETLPDHLRYLVLWEDKVLKNLPQDSGYQTLPLKTTGEIRYFSWNDNQKVILNQEEVIILNQD